MGRSIDLNADVGEGLGAWPMGADRDLIPLVSSVNVACGFHAGDPLTMRRTVRLALEAGAAVGAHPGYPDLVGFGRRAMSMADDELEAAVLYQVAALAGIVRAEGGGRRTSSRMARCTTRPRRTRGRRRPSRPPSRGWIPASAWWCRRDPR